MIKAIIFDLNGVFVKSELLSDRFERDFGVKKEVFLPVLKEVMDKVRRPGAGELFSYWEPHLRKWGVKLSKHGFYDYWFHAEVEDKQMVDLAMDLKKRGLKIIILSNNLKERTAYYLDKFIFLRTLPDKIYFSWQTGFLKSDSRAYQLVLQENNLKPTEVLFFDDSESNLEVAKSVGITAYEFDGIKSVKKQFNSLTI